MKRVAIFGLGFVAILLLAALIVPSFIPTSVYRAQIEKAATEALGVEVTLEGDPKLSILPSLSARIDGVKVANPDGFTDPFMVEAGEIRGSVKILPLLRQKVEIKEVMLADATVKLERLADGRANWELEGLATEETEAPSEEESEAGGFDAGIDRARLRNTSISYIDRVEGTQYLLEDFNASARMTAMDAPLSSSGDGILNGQAFDYDVDLTSIATVMAGEETLLDISLETPLGEISYDGAFALTEDPTFSGVFDVSSDSIASILAFIPMDVPIRRSELQSIRAKGSATGSASAPVLDFDILDFGATGVDFSYTGGVDMTSDLAMNGALDVTLDQPQHVFTDDFEASAPLSLLENFRLKADISGPVTALSLSDVALRQSSDLLTLGFDGALSLAPDSQSDGDLLIASPDLPTLLAKAGFGSEGQSAINAFSIDGKVVGTSDNIALTDAAIEIDEIAGNGTVGLNMTGARPKLVADLNLPVLDLTPFIGASDTASNEPAALDDEWSDEPISMNGLNAADADLKVSAGKVIAGDIELEDALLTGRLENGLLNAGFTRDDNQPGFKAFDGDWSGQLVINAAKATPTMAIDANASGVAAQKLLAAFTGYDGLTGISGMNIDLTSSGNSLKALINGLDGSVNADVADGLVSGIDLAKLVRSADSLTSALRGGGLSVAGFRDAISPDATTDFSSFVSGLSFNNGVATIQQLNLASPVVAVTGSGQIDLGARTLNIRLVPGVDKTAQGQTSAVSIGGIPVPVRISGSWASPSFGIDTAYVQQALTDQLRASAQGEIRNQLGGLLGTRDDSGANADDADENQENREREILNQALGSIFGD